MLLEEMPPQSVRIVERYAIAAVARQTAQPSAADVVVLFGVLPQIVELSEHGRFCACHTARTNFAEMFGV